MQNNPFLKDRPAAIMAANNISKDNLSSYKGIPFKTEGSVFGVCRKGIMEVSINLKEYIIRENDYITLLGHNFVQIHNFSSDLDFSFVWFSREVMHGGESFQKAFDNLLSIFKSPVRKVSFGLIDYMEKMVSICSIAKDLPEIIGNESVMQSMMNTCLYISLNLYNFDDSEKPMFAVSKSYEINKKFISLVIRHYRTERTISFYAKQIGTSKENLCRAIKSCSRMTPLTIIDQFIMLDAKAQLKSTNEPITIIAYSLGFQCLNTFCRFFRKYEKITPSEFRNR